ncbi:MAG: glycosyl hydrolase [bacterium]
MFTGTLVKADPWDDWKVGTEAEATQPALAERSFRAAAVAFEQADDWEDAAYAWTKVFHLNDRLGRLTEAGMNYQREAYCYNKAGHADWAWHDSLRGETLKSAVRVFYRPNTPEILPVAQNLAKYEPGAGIYLGMYQECGVAVDDYSRVKALYGRQHALYLSYGHFYSPGKILIADDTIERIKRIPGAGMVMGLEPNGGLAAMNEADVTIVAQKFAKAGFPVFLRFASEMNMEGSNQWHGDPDLYVTWFRKVATIMRREAPNVVMVWNPFDVIQPEGMKADALKYYPGDDYVDWIGVNFYNDYFFGGKLNEPGEGICPLQRLDYWYRMFASRKPIIIGECGITHRPLKPVDKDVSRWAEMNVRRFFTLLPIMYPRIKAFVYFDLNESQVKNMPRMTNDYRLSGNDDLCGAYRTAIAAPYFLEKVGDSSVEPQYKEVLEGGKLTGVVNLTSYAKCYDPFISHVDYYLNDNLIGTAKQVPYALIYDFSTVTGQAQLTVKVYDSNNLFACSRVVNIDNR